MRLMVERMRIAKEKELLGGTALGRRWRGSSQVMYRRTSWREGMEFGWALCRPRATDKFPLHADSQHRGTRSSVHPCCN